MPDALNFADPITSAGMLDVCDGVSHSGTTNSPRLRKLLSYWNMKRAGRRTPLRTDIDPLDLADLLSILFLIEIETEPRRYRVRLAGTAINHAFDWDYTGCYVDEILPSSAAAGRFDCLVDTASAYRVRTVLGRLRSPLAGYEGVGLPLSSTDHGEVRFILGGMEFFDQDGNFVRCDHPARPW